MTVREYSEIYERRYLPLCMYALRLLGDDEEARDVVQECFVAVWEKLEREAGIKDLKSYLYRAVYNRSMSVIRSRRPEEDLEDISELPDESSLMEAMDTSERDAALWEAIGRLPERCRQVFLLSKRDGLTNAEVARQLGISIKTVENQMTKAYDRLRVQLRRPPGSICFLPFF